MTHKEFIALLQKSCHGDHSQTITLLSALQKLMAKAAVDQIPVILPGLGTFTSHKHPEYIQENPHTGEQILYPPRISYRMQPEGASKTPDGAKTISAELSEYTHFPQSLVDAFLSAVASVVSTQLQNREAVEVHGLGTFLVIEAHQSELQRIAFNPDEQMRESVNAPFNCFEPVVIKPAQRAAEPIVSDQQEAEPDAVSDSGAESSVKAAAAVSDEGLDSEVKSAIVPDSDSDTELVQTIEPEVDSSSITESAIVTDAVSDLEIKEEEVAKTMPAEQLGVEESTKQTVQTNEKTHTEEGGSNKLLYAAVVLVLAVSGALAFYLFQLGSDDADENEVVATVVSVTPASPMQVVSDTLAPDTLLASSMATDTPSAIDSQPASMQVEPNPKADREHAHIAATPATPAIQHKSETPSQRMQPEPQSAVVSKVEVAKAEVTETAKLAAKAEPKTEPKVPKIFHRLLGADGQPVSITLNPGERLTVIALREFGDKAFWPYIFDVNSDRIKAPNLVQAGMKLYLPDPAYYQIDANSEESLRKAKNHGAQLLK